MKKILVVWIIIAVILIAGLTILGFHIKKQNEPYKKLEKELEKQAISLIGEKPSYFPNGGKLTLEDFRNNNYEVSLKVDNDVCTDGYVIVSKNMGILDYKGYVKCNNYTTHGYKK